MGEGGVKKDMEGRGGQKAESGFGVKGGRGGRGRRERGRGDEEDFFLYV
jgi:hypothetical protein